MEDIIYAKDMKCCVCGKPAVVLWPNIDIDIPSHPYCRECVEREKTKHLYELLKSDKKLNH